MCGHATLDASKQARLAREALKTRSSIFPVQGHGEALSKHDSAGALSLKLARA